MSDWGVRLNAAIDRVPFEFTVALWLVGIPLLAVGAS
jgi:hypothetical protein